MRLTPDAGRQQQTLDDLAVFEVGVDNFVNVGVVDEAVPDGFGVDHGDRAAGAAVQAARFVDADLADAAQALLFNPHFAVVKARLGMVLGAAFFTGFALIEAKKNVAFVI